MKEVPAPVQLKLSELVIDTKYSGRSEKEIKANAKELAKEMEAYGEWDYKQPGQVFRDSDGKLHLRAGFTRVEASEIAGFKTGWFFELDKTDELENRLACITTNGGKSISRLEQGKLFKSLEAGVIADNFNGTVADPSKKEHWKIQPMTDKEISQRIGKTSEHVRQCKIIADSSPEIAELVEADAVSHNIVVTAYAWAKGKPERALKILKAAIREAGGEKATKKDMDVIKSQFVEQKAVTKSGGDGGADDSEKGELEKPKHKSDVFAKNEGSKTSENGELELPENPQQEQPPTKRETKSIVDAALVVILKWDEEVATASISDEDGKALIERLAEAGLLIQHLPL